MNTPKTVKPSLFSYVGWKILLCILSSLPAVAAAFLICLFCGTTSGVPADAVGLPRYSRILAAFVGLALFYYRSFRVLRSAKLPTKGIGLFLLKETLAYAVLLFLQLVILMSIGQETLRQGYLTILLLPHTAFSFFGSPFFCLLQIPLYTLTVYIAYRLPRNGKRHASEAVEGNFTEAASDPIPSEEEKETHENS